MQQASTTQTPIPGAVLARVVLQNLARRWWLLLLRGLCAIIFGAVCIVWPATSLLTFALIFGAYAVMDGVLAIIAAFTGEATSSRWWLAVLGIAGIVAGLMSFVWPGLTALVLLYVIAIWAIVSGLSQIFGAIRLRKAINNEWLLIASGSLSILFGAMLLAQPGQGALALAFVIGFFAVLYGILLILFSLRLRPHARAQN